MPRIVVQRRVVREILPEIVRYLCDACGKPCGTTENRKETWYSPEGPKYYCKKTCSPAGCRGAY